MARYKLGVFSKKNEGRIINLDSIVKLENLKTLDEFTTAFNNESELKVYLFNQGIITQEELSQNISIRYKYNGKIKKLPIFYQEMKKYLDMIHLKYELKGLCGDVEFLEKLANYYSNGSTTFNKQGCNVHDIRVYLSDVRSNGGHTFHSTLLEKAINDLFEKVIIRDTDKKTGEVIEDYRGMRDLALLIYKYKKAVEVKEENKKIALQVVGEQTSLFDESYVKKLQASVEKTNNVKWNLSSEGDPDFAYNSEEEKQYEEYMENLPDEEHPHHIR